MTAKPDRFQVIPGQINEMTDASPNQLNYDNNVHGDFFFDDNNKEISFLSESFTSIFPSQYELSDWLSDTQPNNQSGRANSMNIPYE